ncbi:Mg2+ transporter [Grosmannia clavigera kw1407]|uniref:Mg2+ transporter n=1 Tax=Grosmannia clavigera (strain kw1407 / UAMH 11150) TaxID=655863 RepID=F0XH72_GROCL|nr:Mg2+ transporter [Grosmannia clavigera kw1407]EFX03055.1 Mg2+ transporter [Grosmannia clavigera kw1407]
MPSQANSSLERRPLPASRPPLSTIHSGDWRGPGQPAYPLPRSSDIYQGCDSGGSMVSPYYRDPYYPSYMPNVPLYYQPHPMQFANMVPPPSRIARDSNAGFQSPRMDPQPVLYDSPPSISQQSSPYSSDSMSRPASPKARTGPRKTVRIEDVSRYEDESDSWHRSSRKVYVQNGVYDDGVEEGVDEFDDGTPPTVYSFTPRHMSRVTSSQGSSHGDDDSPDKEEDTATGNVGNGDGGPDGAKMDPDLASNIDKLSHVFQSQYVGEFVPGGWHSAKITTVVSSSSKLKPLFKWLHCTRKVMDFSDFSRTVRRSPNLSPTELKGIRDLLATVQRKFVRSVQTANGQTVHHMEPSCIQHVLPPDDSAKASTFSQRTLTWVCMPFFSLEKYSGLQEVPRNMPAFPIETLLQSKFSRATRERDMQQAICQNQGKGMPAGLCYHVAQIWCLVIDNSFLFTYSHMSEEMLVGDAIEIAEIPIQQMPNTGHQSVITVAYKRAVLWSIPVEDCKTWLEFLSHFRDFWPQRLSFFRRTRPVEADDWPRIWNLAQHVQNHITLEMRLKYVLPYIPLLPVSSLFLTVIRPPALPPPAGVLAPQQEDTVAEISVTPLPAETAAPGPSLPAAKVVSGARSSATTQGPIKPSSSAASVSTAMPIFSCLTGVTRPDHNTIDEDALDDHLREAEEFILSATSFSDRHAYNACPNSTRDEISAHLQQVGAELAKITDQKSVRSQLSQQRFYEIQLDVFNAASMVFAYFFPPGVNVPTVQKFWGAVQIIVNAGLPVVSTSQGPAPLNIHSSLDIRSELQRLCTAIQAFSEIFARSSQQERANITVPKEVLGSWIHLLMGLIHQPRDIERSDQLIGDARLLFHGSMATVVRSLSKAELLEASVVLPLELLSLIVRKLVQDMTLGMPRVDTCYYEKLEKMNSEITSEASDRFREYRIGLLMEELVAVEHVVDMQVGVFQSLKDFQCNSDTLNKPPRRAHYTPRRPVPELSYDDRRLPSPPPATCYTSRWRSDRRNFNRVSDYYTNDVPEYVALGQPVDLRLLSTDPSGYRSLLLNDCLQFVEGRNYDFTSLRERAKALESKNRNKIDTTKDRHDNAIYAFTIVTIIFLPLSAVAGIFGMNTNDVRNMELDQWAYWATAVPVTAVVIFLGLMWTGELGSIMHWIQSFGKHQQGYRIPPDSLREDDDYEQYTASLQPGYR